MEKIWAVFCYTDSLINHLFNQFHFKHLYASVVCRQKANEIGSHRNTPLFVSTLLLWNIWSASKGYLGLQIYGFAQMKLLLNVRIQLSAKNLALWQYLNVSSSSTTSLVANFTRRRGEIPFKCTQQSRPVCAQLAHIYIITENRPAGDSL